jgi:NAD(P)H-hydrate epimerase
MKEELFLSRAQVRAFDQFAIERIDIPAVVLMENAGRGAAQILQSLGIRGPVVVCCGKGNNGGDGLVMMRHLANWGFEVRALLFASPEDLAADAFLQWNIVRKMALPYQVITDVESQMETLTKVDWIVDALFGTGLTGAVRTPLDRAIESINTCGVRVLAVDIPSGLDCDTGLPLGATIRAEHTVTFVAPKLGFRNPASLAYTGRVHVADIGIAFSEPEAKDK